MQRNTFQFQHQQIPTLQSIEAHSQVSIDLRPNEQQPLISKIFMLCIQIERKDMIIDQLQTQAQFQNQMKKSQIDVANRQLLTRYDRIQQQNRILIQSNVMLKNNVASLERIIADLEIHKQRSTYNKQLQQKVYSLELILKKAQQQKIEYLQRQKNLKRQNSMLSYSAIKTSQKNRIRDLETELAQQKAKLDAQKRITADLRYQVEKDTSEIKVLKENQFTLKRTYQQTIQKIEIVRVSEDLKKSQISAVKQQKVVLLTQELNRIRQELEYQTNFLKEQKNKNHQKQDDIKKLNQQIKLLQSKLKSQKNIFQTYKEQAHKKQLSLIQKIQISQQSIKNLKTSHREIEQYMKQKSIQQNGKSNEIDRIYLQLQSSERQKEQLRTELRKLKRRNPQNNVECQICKIRSSTTISSSKSIKNLKTMNLQQIIKQTEKLNLSNKKVQSLINHHQISINYSQQTLANITGDSC